MLIPSLRSPLLVIANEVKQSLFVFPFSFVCPLSPLRDCFGTSILAMTALTDEIASGLRPRNDGTIIRHCERPYSSLRANAVSEAISFVKKRHYKYPLVIANEAKQTLFVFHLFFVCTLFLTAHFMFLHFAIHFLIPLKLDLFLLLKTFHYFSLEKSK